MAGVQLRDFDSPDETRTSASFTLGRLAIKHDDGTEVEIGRATRT
jgi:hypothetical protein